MRFELNLATRQHYNRIGMHKCLLVASVLLALLLTVLLVRITGQQRMVVRLDDEITRMNQQLSGKQAGVSEKDSAAQKQRVTALNTIIQRRANSSWVGIFDALEAVVPDGVAVTKVALEPKEDQLKLEGRAKNFAAIKQLLENLDQSRQFREALLLSHSDVIFGDKAKGLQFSLSSRMVRP